MNKIGVCVLLLMTVLFSGCNKDDGITIPLNSEINEFVWQGMRTYYFWQSENSDLADDRFSTFDELHTFLNGYRTPEMLFDHFLFEEDRFSWIVEDFEELDNSFQGISTSFGYEFRLVKLQSSGIVFGYVEYVLEQSPAANAGLERGDIFYAVDGNVLSETNFRALLLEQDSYSLSLAKYLNSEEGIEDVGEMVTLTATELTENPIFLTKVIEVDGIKVGYLVYNQFISTFHSELNAAIGSLVSEGVTEMVLDLRYNPGGSVTTSRVLASMLYNDGRETDIFGEIVYNDRLSEFDSNLLFFENVPILDSDNNQIGEETMNRLELSRVFILTGAETASASELVIIGLRPYMEVTLIGDTTVGKNVGSVTLYDSPDEGYLSRNSVNPNHKYAMQPIISQLSNSQGFTNYTDGLAPNISVEEMDYLADLQPLGEMTEPLLAEALGIISGSSRSAISPSLNVRSVFNSKESRPHLFRGILLPQEIIPNQIR